MRRTSGVHVDLSAKHPGEFARRARVVQMNVRQDDVPDLFGLETGGTNTFEQRGNGAFRAAVDQDVPVEPGDQMGGHGLRRALQVQVDGVNGLARVHG